MAKTTSKKTTSKPKEPVAKKTSAKKTNSLSPSDQIEKACHMALDKLKALTIEPELQSDLEWCLGSYASDKNPIGLYEMARRAADVFRSEQTKKTKGVTAKLIGDLDKAIANQ